MDADYMIRVMHVKGANGEAKTLRFPLRLDLDRPKRARTTFTETQLRLLDEAYKRNGYLTGERRAKLAMDLGLTDTQVKVWFQNRRTKDRKRKHSDDENHSTPSPTSPSTTVGEASPPTEPPINQPTSTALTTSATIPSPAQLPLLFPPPPAPLFAHNLSLFPLTIPLSPQSFFIPVSFPSTL